MPFDTEFICKDGSSERVSMRRLQLSGGGLLADLRAALVNSHMLLAVVPHEGRLASAFRHRQRRLVVQ